jgi:hypothetical protein
MGFHRFHRKRVPRRDHQPVRAVPSLTPWRSARARAHAGQTSRDMSWCWRSFTGKKPLGLSEDGIYLLNGHLIGKIYENIEDDHSPMDLEVQYHIFRQTQCDMVLWYRKKTCASPSTRNWLFLRPKRVQNEMFASHAVKPGREANFF